jgi:ABC-2 type transport system permease protein
MSVLDVSPLLDCPGSGFHLAGRPGGIIGAGIGASRWLLDTSVLHHIARAPAAPVQWDMAAILAGIGIAATAEAAAFARRDLAGA